MRLGFRRSGRFKCKGPVIEENSIDEALDVDEYLSEEEGSEYSGEMQGDKTADGASTSGFGKLLHFKVEGISSKLGFYVLDNFDETTMEIKLENASLLITMESIPDMIGIINKGVDIFVEHVVKDAQMIKNWEDQFGEICGFEKTFDAAKGMFPWNTMFDELKKRFIKSLKYQQEENADIGRASVHTEDETMANEGQEQSMEYGERIARGLDSPRYQLGPQTQAIICETVDKLYKESKRKKMMDFSDIPSFSLGLTQEEYDMGVERHKEDANTYEKDVKARQGPLDVVLLIFLVQPTKVVNADKVENSKEKRLVKFLFNKRDGDDSDVMFTTKYGHQSSRGQIETLGPQESVDDNVLSSWSVYLNFMKEKKDFISPTRLFFPTFEVVFLLISNDQQEFLVCVNLKNLAVTLIDSKKEGNKVTRKKKKDDGVDDMRVASILVRTIDCARDIGKWKCGLDVEGKKQNTQLGRLRNKYAAKLQLSDCNIYKGYLEKRVYDVILMHVIVRICYEPHSMVLGFEMEFWLFWLC
nr:hypothetical protein [Tanacetum cinerariifolium]